MAITSTTKNDLVNVNSNLLINSIPIIENLTFTKSNLQINFPPISQFSISASDFLDFMKIISIWQINLINVFTPKVNSSTTFDITQVANINNGVSSLDFVFKKSNHKIYDITATYPTGNVVFKNRSVNENLNYDEFLYFLSCVLDFKLSVKRFFNIPG